MIHFILKWLLLPLVRTDTYTKKFLHFKNLFFLWKMFPEFFAGKNLKIIIPAINFKTDPESAKIIPYKEKNMYDLPGTVHVASNWIVYDDAMVGNQIKSVFEKYGIVVTEELDVETSSSTIYENLLCVGGQSNFYFYQFFIREKIAFPVLYEHCGNFDRYYNSRTGKEYKSNDPNYGYGVFVSIKNKQDGNSRIVLIAGLSRESTGGVGTIFSRDSKRFYESLKKQNLLGCNFYCIVTFNKTKTEKPPLTFAEYEFGEIVRNE